MLAKLEPRATGSGLSRRWPTIETLLGDGRPRQAGADRHTFCARREHGDFGWIVSAATPSSTAQEYGWGEPFEGLCAQIVADFVNNFDPTRERCWIAEMNGENVGSSCW